VLACHTLAMLPHQLCAVPDERVSAKDHEPKADSKTWFEMYVDGMSIDPLQKAYVLLIPVSKKRYFDSTGCVRDALLPYQCLGPAARNRGRAD